MRSSRHQAREVRHIDQIERADFVRNLTHAGEVDDPRISAAAANNQLRALRRGDLFQVVVINRLRFPSHAVGNYFVSLAGEIQRMSMREVSAVSEIQT